MELMIPVTTNAPSGNNQVLTLKAGFDIRPHELAIGLTSIQFNYSGAPKGDFWKASATEGSEYVIIVHRRMKS